MKLQIKGPDPYLMIIIVLLYILTMVQLIRADPFVEFNITRAERGLKPFIEILQLDLLATSIVPFQVQNGHIDHNVPPAFYKRALEVNALGWMIFMSGVPQIKWRAFELLASFPANFTDSQIAHVFDTSPIHSGVFYNDRTLWVGFALQDDPKTLSRYMVFIAIEIKEGVNIDELRFLSF